MAAPALDDLLFAKAIPGPVRRLFQILDETLRKSLVVKDESLAKLASGTRPTRCSASWRVNCGLGEVEVLASAIIRESPSPGRACPRRSRSAGNWWTLIRAEMRFYAARSLKMIQCGLVAPFCVARASWPSSMPAWCVIRTHLRARQLGGFRHCHRGDAHGACDSQEGRRQGAARLAQGMRIREGRPAISAGGICARRQPRGVMYTGAAASSRRCAAWETRNNSPRCSNSLPRTR